MACAATRDTRTSESAEILTRKGKALPVSLGVQTVEPAGKAKRNGDSGKKKPARLLEAKLRLLTLSRRPDENTNDGARNYRILQHRGHIGKRC